MLKYFLPLLALTLCLAPPVTADVVVDDFSEATLSETSVYSQGGFSLNRRITPVSAPSFVHTGNGFLALDTDFTVEYEVTNGGTFADISPLFSKGFSVFVGNAGATYKMEIAELGFDQDIVSGEQVFEFDVNSLSTLTFTIYKPTGGPVAGTGSVFFGGSFSAVPEPTSLALAGMGLASVCCIRRRRR